MELDARTPPAGRGVRVRASEPCVPAARLETPADPAEPIRTAFAARIGAVRYQMWFPPNAAFVWLGHELVVACRSPQFHDWASEKFTGELTKAAAGVTGQPVPARPGVEIPEWPVRGQR